MPKRPQKKIVGERLAELMADRGVRDSPLARAIGVSPSQIKRWKHNEQGAMPDAVRALANFFEVSEAYFYGIDTEDIREQIAREVQRALGQPEADIVRALGALSEADRYKMAGRVIGWIENAVSVPLPGARPGSVSLMRRDAAGHAEALPDAVPARTSPSPTRSTKP